MWIWSKSGRTLVNMAHVESITVYEDSVIAFGVTNAGDGLGNYTLFEGTEAECKAYLEQLDLDLAEQGDRVAVALEEQNKLNKRHLQLNEVGLRNNVVVAEMNAKYFDWMMNREELEQG